MQFRYVDTAEAYRRLLAAPDAAARTTIFGAELAAPFAGLARFFGQDDPAAAFAQWGMVPEQFAPERHAEQTAKLDALLGANTWARAASALEEGLAESFAAELYGPKAVGPWVTAFDQAQLESSRAIFREALDATGFDVVRHYIFGGGTHTTAAGEVVPIAPLAGYALGYAVVQTYVHRTGRSVVEATLVPATELIAESQFFT